MEVVKILGQACPESELVTLYTVPEGKGCVISYLNICNRENYDSTISILIGSAQLMEAVPLTPELYMEYDMIVYGNCSSQRLKGVTIAAGDCVVVVSSTGGISFNLFGSEFDQSFEYP